MTNEMFEEITAWQRKTFPQATALSAAKHLQEETIELLADLATGKITAANMEFADCFLLLFGAAKLHGLDYENICKVINRKMEINKQRQWGSVNEKGYVKHVLNSEQEVQVSDTTKLPNEPEDDKQK